MATIQGTLKSDASKVGRDLILFLAPWRTLEEGPPEATPIRIVVALPEPRVQALAPQLTKGTIVDIADAAPIPPARGTPWWTASGTEVSISAPAPIARTVVVVDEILGTFTLERGTFVGERAIADQRYRLSIHSSGQPGSAPEAEVAAARRDVERFEAALPAIRNAVTLRLQPLYNGTWRGEGDEVSMVQFRTRISLASVNVYGSGDLTAYFADGDLFAGHWIEVDLDAEMQVTDATLAG